MSDLHPLWVALLDADQVAMKLEKNLYFFYSEPDPLRSQMFCTYVKCLYRHSVVFVV